MSDPAVAAATYPKEIAEAIAKVMSADLYLQKRGKNEFHKYMYATVGDLLDKLQPLMAAAGLIVFQHEKSADIIDGGNVMVIHYEFTLAHISGAVWPEKPSHTGMSACRNSKGGFDDKAANKCHTAARKYFLLGLFQVPTGEDYREAAHDGDTDGQDHAPPPSRSRMNGAAHAAPLPAPAHVAPPHDPETGEVGPHKIAVPLRRGTNLPDWLAFGSQVIAAFKAAAGSAELAKWHHLNAPNIAEMANAAPKAHGSVIKALEQCRERFLPAPAPGAEPEMLAPDETDRVLA